MFKFHGFYPVFKADYVILPAFCMMTLTMCAVSQAQICPSQSYQWPVAPGGNTQQRLNSTFMEYRAGHFHDGIDIQADSGTSVIACSDNMKVVSINDIDTYEGQPDKQMFVQELNSPFRIFFYDHMQSIATGLTTESILSTAGDEIGITNFRNHLHFNEGEDHSEVHPLRDNESLCSFSDTTRPKITNFRVHKDGQHGYDAQMPKDDDGIYNVTGRG